MSAFGVSGATQIKDLPCYQYVGKFNSVPGHHVFNRLALPQTLILVHSVPKFQFRLAEVCPKHAICQFVNRPVVYFRQETGYNGYRAATFLAV
jgi:hypothetical protein